MKLRELLGQLVIREGRFVCVLLALLSVCADFSANASSASYTLYPSLSSWQSAVGTSYTSIGFEGIAGNFGYQYYPTPPGLTLSGVNFTIDPSLLPTGGSLYVLGPYFVYPGDSVLEAQQSQPGSDNILMTFPGPISALSLNFGDRSGNDIIGFKLSDGESFNMTVPLFNQQNAPAGFLGLTFSTPITSIDEYRVTPGTELDVDNVAFTLAVPEPSTCGLMIFGAGLALSGPARFSSLLVSKHR